MMRLPASWMYTSTPELVSAYRLLFPPVFTSTNVSDLWRPREAGTGYGEWRSTPCRWRSTWLIVMHAPSSWWLIQNQCMSWPCGAFGQARALKSSSQQIAACSKITDEWSKGKPQGSWVLTWRSKSQAYTSTAQCLTRDRAHANKTTVHEQKGKSTCTHFKSFKL